MPERRCVRCGQPIREKGRRKYCGDACADSAMRARIRQLKAQLRSMPRARRLYRYFPAPEP